MKTLFSGLLGSLLFGLAAATAATPAAVQPFRAEYATYRNGSELGQTTLELSDNHDGSWTLRSETRGTAGLARLAGVHIVETSRFRWQDDRPVALAYDYRQTGIKRRTREARFDWDRNEVVVKEDGEHRYATVPGLIDRQSVTLALAADLMRGAKTFNYKVAVADQVEDMEYVLDAPDTVTVPAGRYDTAVVKRDRMGRNHRRRVSRSWFASSLGWLPVQIEQADGKGETVTLKLVATPANR